MIPSVFTVKMDDTKKDFVQVVSGSTEVVEQALPRGRRISQWEGPNNEFMQALLNLGISKNAAEKVSFLKCLKKNLFTCHARDSLSV